MSQSLLTHCWKKGIQLSLIDENLSFKAADGAVTADILASLKANKAELIKLLKQQPSLYSTRPLSENERALWFLYRLRPESNAYNMAYGIKLKQVYSQQQIETAFIELCKAHPILALNYGEHDGEPFQQLTDFAPSKVCFERQEQLSSEQIDAWLTKQADTQLRPDHNKTCHVAVLHHSVSNDEGSDDNDNVDCYLSMVIHHIAADFISFEILRRDFMRVLAGKTIQAREFPAHDYQTWAQRQFNSQFNTEESYWLNTLKDLPQLQLPTDYTYQDNALPIGGEVHATLAADLSEKIITHCREQAVTPYLWWLGAFQWFMARLSGQDEFIIGTPSSGRLRPEDIELVGYLVNPLALHCHIKPEQNFVEWLASVKASSHDVLTHQAYPFAKLIDKLDIDRNASRSPVFQHMFTLNSASEDSLVDELVDTELLAEQRGAAHELNLVVVDDKDSFTCKWRFNKGLYKDETVANIQKMFMHWVAQLVNKPALTLQSIATAPSELLSSLTGQALTVPAQTAWQAFLSQVNQGQHKLALRHQSTVYSYKQLFAKVDQAAHSLHQLGFKQGDRLGVILPRSIEQIIAMLAAWRLGGSFLIFDCDWPASRVSYLCDDAQLSVVICQTDKLAHYQSQVSLSSDVFLTAEQFNASENLAQASPLADVSLSEHAEAYLIYTSGSTGNPKAVSVSQSNLINYVTGLVEQVTLSANATMTSLSKHSADLGYTALFGALLTGRQFVVIDEALSLDSQALLQELTQRPVDCLKIVPSHLNGLLLAEASAALLPKQALIFGGEAISAQVVDKVNQYKSQASDSSGKALSLYNHYGPTEATIGSLIHTIDIADKVKAESFEAIPIGQPLANCEVKVVDNSNHIQAIGLPGELHISGPNVVKGYVDNSADDKINTHGKFYLEQGKSWYKTGDKVLCCNDAIYYLGRYDDQIKIRGFRVELAEIELWLKQFIDDVAVIASTGQSDEDSDNKQNNLRISAFIVADEQTLNKVQQDIQQALPEYMIPANWQLLDALPRLANGKVDKKALQLLSVTSKTQDEVRSVVISEQQNETAQKLLEIWTSLLNRDDLTLDDDFFAAGGDSILGLQVIAKARAADIVIKPQQLFQYKTINALVNAIAPVPAQSKAELILLDVIRGLLNNANISVNDDFFAAGGDSILSLQLVAKARQAGLNISPKDVFEYKSISKLVTALNLDAALEKLTGDVESSAQATVVTEVEKQLPTTPFSLTPIQHWFFEQELAAPAYWNQSILLAVKTRLNLSSLTKAVNELVKQHASLRLAFSQNDGQWQQFYQAYDTDFANAVVSACDEQMSEALLSQYQQQFTLANAPLIRFVYFPNSNALLCTAHHLIVDAVSWQIIVEDLLAVYQQQAQGLPAKLTPVASEFYQWQAYLASLLSKDNQDSEAITSAVDYWQQQLSITSAVDSGFNNSYAESCHLSSHFDLATTTSLTHVVNAAYNTKTPELLITALVKTLLQHWQLSELTIELEGHGRESQVLTQQSSLDLSRTIGWFTSRFPQKFSANQSLSSDIIDTKEQLRKVPDNGASYGVVRYLNDVLSKVNTGQNWGFSNLVSFNYLGKRRTKIDENFSLAEGLLNNTRADDNQRAHLLDVNAMIVDDKLTIDWCYAKSHEKFADIEQLIQLFTVNIHAIISHCMAPENGRPTASDFPLARLTEHSFAALLDELSSSQKTLSSGNNAIFSDVLSQQVQD